MDLSSRLTPRAGVGAEGDGAAGGEGGPERGRDPGGVSVAQRVGDGAEDGRWGSEVHE